MQKPLSQIQRSTFSPFQHPFIFHSFGGFGLRSGQIIECLDDDSLNLPKKAMLEALQDTGVPHDINNRFTRPMLHAYEEELKERYRVYLREQGYKFPVPEVVVTGDSQEA